MGWTPESLDQLERDRIRLIEDLRAIEGVLRREGRLSDLPDESGTSEVVERGNGRHEGGEIRNEVPTGLRAAVRRVLAVHHPRGLKPKEVTAILVDEGFQASGSTDIGTRVAGEMARMRRRRVLRKMRSGRYRLRLPSQPDPVGL